MTATLDHAAVDRAALDRPALGGMHSGVWHVDGARSHLEVAVRVGGLATVRGRFRRLAGSVDIDPEPSASTVSVEVETASLTSGSDYRDRMLAAAGLVDVVANPLLVFTSTDLLAGPAPRRWRLDGLLSTRTGALPLSLDLAGPAVLAPDRVGFRARGSLPREHATLLLAGPGVERLLGPTLSLDLVVEAVGPSR